MIETAPPDLREALARALYEHDNAGLRSAPAWGDALDAQNPDRRDRYLSRADALTR